MLGFGITDKGMVRANNEDSIFISNEKIGKLQNLYIVADGMGGHNAGEVASQSAIRYFCEYIENETKIESELDILVSACLYANKKVLEIANENIENNGMGTTLVAVTIKENKAYIINIGDSRLYILKDNLEQITKDHSYVRELVKAGQITKQEAKIHPDRNMITRVLGFEEEIKIDTFIAEIDFDDKILLCSDGLFGMIEEDVAQKILLNKQINITEKLDLLVKSANDLGGKDNISVIIIDNETGRVN